MELKKKKSKISRPLADLIVIVVIALVVFVAAVWVEAFERVFYWTQRYEDWELDELLSVGFVLPVAFAVYAWRRWADYRQALRQAEATLDKLNRALDEKEMLLREVHHRTKNSLAIAASLIRFSNQTAGHRAELDEIASRISALASVHEYLQDSESANTVDLHAHLDRVVTAALSGVPSVAIENHVGAMSVPTKTAVNLGLALNEIAANAAKHGFGEEGPPLFRMETRQEGSTVVLTATNSGKPLPPEIGLENPPTLGLKLVSMLVRQLGGSVALHRVPQAQIEIRVPHPVGYHGVPQIP